VSVQPRFGQRLATWWVDRLTAHLPDQVRDRRRAEIRSDLWEQAHDAALAGRAEVRTQLDLAMRTLTGIPADLSWSRTQRRQGGAMSAPVHPSSASFVSPAVAIGVVVASVVSVAALVVGGPLVAAGALVVLGVVVVVLARSARARRPAVRRASSRWGTVAFGAVGALMLTFLAVALLVEDELSEPAWTALAGLVLLELATAMVALVLWLSNRPSGLRA
jgi:lysylphosphatidylglycerol synthetase-like protein (DUF2156 family)